MKPDNSSSLGYVDNIGLPTLVLSGAFEVLRANNAFSSAFGTVGQEVSGSQFTDLGLQFLSEDKNELSAKQLSLGLLDLAKGFGRSRIIGVSPTGKNRKSWFRLTVTANYTPEGSLSNLVLCFSDVTDFMADKRNQSLIFQAKSEWETTVDALQDIVTIQNREMEILRANKRAHELFGYKFGELTGKKCYEAFHGLEKPCPGCPVVQTGLDRCPHTGSIHNPRLNRTFSVSSFPIISEGGEMNQLVHVARDVSQYLKNESEKNRLMQAIEQASESVVITNKKAEIQYVNPAFEDISGYGRDEVIGKNLNILKSGAHDRDFYEQMWQTLLSGRVWRGRLTNRRKNGTLYKEDATISPVFGSKGEIENFVSLKRDVTREDQLEQQLQQAMKMEALGTLAGGIAHDFNNILSAMIGYVEIAKGKLAPNHPAQKDLQQVLGSGDRAVDLVKQILTFSRRDKYQQFQTVKIQYIVKEIVKLLRPSLPATIDLTHDVDTSCRPIFADPGQLYQVIINLCTNARQAIGDAHGTISITLREIGAEDSGMSQTPAASGDAYLELAVCDTGCGIEESKLAMIYDPFYTTKTKDQGTGLGLAVVHGIIKKHKGEIHVSSILGRGTTFYIYLAVDSRGVEQIDSTADQIEGGSETIMIIDDEPAVADVLAMGIKKAGYTAITFNDSIAAVEYFRENPKCCDLVITDMLMPNMTGAELSRELLSVNKAMPIIMLTGHSEHFDREKALQLGIREFIFKPVKRNKLLENIRKVLGDV